MHITKLMTVALALSMTQPGWGFNQETFEYVKKYKKLPYPLTLMCEGARDLEARNFCQNKNSQNLTAASDLSDANFSGVDLSNADLSKANLSGADLSKATLSGTILPTGNQLKNTNFKGAAISNTFYLKSISRGMRGYSTSKEKVDKEWLKKQGALVD
jgi:hypothetical protein